VKQKFAWILVALLALSLVATSLVSARNFLTQDVMSAPFVSIPEGSTHYGFDGDYITQDSTIGLTSNWTTDLPMNTCAIAARVALFGTVANKYAALQPQSGQAYAVQTLTQVPYVWNSTAGIVPINTYPPTVQLDINNPGYVYIEITGYWVCDDYMPPPRPTLAP